MAERDYGYVAYFRKAIDNFRDDTWPLQPKAGFGPPSAKESKIRKTMYHEGLRDYFTASLRQIKHLNHVDQKPNLELMEPKWELYKVSISFQEGKLI